MSVSLEPEDVPETVESETPPTPAQIEAPESNQTQAPEGIPSVSAKTKDAVATSNGSVRLQCDENPVEAREPISLHHPKGEASIKSQGDENPVKKRGRPGREVPKEPNTPKAAPKKAVRMKPPSPVNESCSEEETPLTRGDMGTLLLDYLVKRKQSQQAARRTMWSQLAGLS